VRFCTTADVRKVLLRWTVLQDVAGVGQPRRIIAGYLATRWLAGFGTSGFLLGPHEWASLMAAFRSTDAGFGSRISGRTPTH
jgi:hypothetical protein